MLTLASFSSSDTQVIPLSANTFVSVQTGDYKTSVIPLAKTIIATDPSVAIPASAAQQTSIIQDEKDAYSAGSQTTSTPSLSVTHGSGLSFTLQYQNLPAGTMLQGLGSDAKTVIAQTPSLNGSGAVVLNLPTGTLSGSYYVVAVMASGQAVELKDASNNTYPLSVWLTVQ